MVNSLLNPWLLDLGPSMNNVANPMNMMNNKVKLSNILLKALINPYKETTPRQFINIISRKWFFYS